MICAIGSPLRVTRIGWPVLFILSSKARQVALNFEMGTFSISIVISFLSYYGRGL